MARQALISAAGFYNQTNRDDNNKPPGHPQIGLGKFEAVSRNSGCVRDEPDYIFTPSGDDRRAEVLMRRMRRGTSQTQPMGIGNS